MIYVFVFVVTLVIAALSQTIACGNTVKGEPKYNRKQLTNEGYIFIIIFLSLFIGLRSVEVGADTWVYFYHFNNLEGVQFDSLVANYRTDIGFYIFTWIFSNIMHSFQLYLLALAFFHVASVFALIKNCSAYPLYSIALYYCLGLFTFSISTLRQMTAMSFCCIAYILLEKSKKKSLMLILLGVTFHYTALIFVPVLFFDKIRITKAKVLVFGIIFVIVFFAKDRLAEIFLMVVSLSGSGKSYGTMKVGGVGMCLFLLMVTSIYAYICLSHRLEGDQTTCREVLILYSALLVFSASRFNLIAMRLYYFYLVIMVAVIPNMLRKIKIMGNRFFIGNIVLIIAFYYLLFKVFDDPYAVSRKLLPYTFLVN